MAVYLYHTVWSGELQLKPGSDTDVASVLLPQGFDAQNWEVVGFLQNKTTGAISGAARATATGLNAGGQPVAKSSM